MEFLNIEKIGRVPVGDLIEDETGRYLIVNNPDLVSRLETLINTLTVRAIVLNEDEENPAEKWLSVTFNSPLESYIFDLSETHLLLDVLPMDAETEPAPDHQEEN